MSDLLSVVASLVSQHMQVYNKRQTVMRAQRHMEYTEYKPSERYNRRVQEWFKAAVEDLVDFDRLHRFELCLRGNYTSNYTWFKSERAKKERYAQQVAHNEWLTKNGYSRDLDPAKQAQELLEIQQVPVHPFAKQILAYMKLRSSKSILTKKQASLREALRQLNNLKLGFKVTFGNRNKYASDRIASVTVGERTFKPKEFLQHIEFESKVLE